MAVKRGLEVPQLTERCVPARDQGWRNWLFRTYARVWYWIVLMVIDMGLLFELPRSLNISTGITVLVVIAVLLLQIAIYVRVWGENAFRDRKGVE